MIRVAGRAVLRTSTLATLVALLAGCEMVKEKINGMTREVSALSKQLTSELGTPVAVNLANGSDLKLTLKNVAPGANPRDFARAVAEFGRVYYAKPEKLQRISVVLTDSAGKSSAGTTYTWTIPQLASDNAAAEAARVAQARADSIANAPPPVPVKGAKPKAPATKAPATKK